MGAADIDSLMNTPKKNAVLAYLCDVDDRRAAVVTQMGDQGNSGDGIMSIPAGVIVEAMLQVIISAVKFPKVELKED